jgi:hypothetical protein
MYLVWKQHRHTAHRDRDLVSHYVYLMESVQGNGKRCQRVVAYLGSVRVCDDAEEDVETNAVQRGFFWSDLVLKLDGLPVERAERMRIEEQIAVRVPRPSESVPSPRAGDSTEI